jgi:hypothetical protein
LLLPEADCKTRAFSFRKVRIEATNRIKNKYGNNLMKKLNFLLAGIFAVISLFADFGTSYADCNPPAGIPTTPAWTEGTEPITFFVDGSDICQGGTFCEVRIHWCYREVDGTCEVLIGDIEMVDLINDPENEKTEFCWDRWEEIKELYIDKAIFNIAFNMAPCLYAHNIEDCDDDPSDDPWVIFATEASCQTEPQLEMDFDGNLKSVKYRCDSESFCEYRYSYCREYDENGELVSIYSKELLMSTTVQCEPLLKSNRYISCFPEDCHLDRDHIYVPTDDQMQTAPTSEDYYINHQAGPFQP